MGTSLVLSVLPDPLLLSRPSSDEDGGGKEKFVIVVVGASKQFIQLTIQEEG